MPKPPDLESLPLEELPLKAGVESSALGCLLRMGFLLDPSRHVVFRNSPCIQEGKSLLGASCDRWGMGNTGSRSPSSAGGGGDLRHCATVFFLSPGASNHSFFSPARQLGDCLTYLSGCWVTACCVSSGAQSRAQQRGAGRAGSLPSPPKHKPLLSLLHFPFFLHLFLHALRSSTIHLL